MARLGYGDPEFCFTYACAGTHAELSRAEAIDRLANKAGNVVVTYFPGHVAVEISAGGIGGPEVKIDGWGHQAPRDAARHGRLLVEAATVAASAEVNR